MIKVKCKVCGKEFDAYPSTVNHKKYCSKECRESKTHIISRCLWCGKEYKVAKSRYNQNYIRFKMCSQKCYNSFLSEERKKIEKKHSHICTNCGLIFSARRYNKTSLCFCSQKCSKEYMVGEKSPTFSGGSITCAGYKVLPVEGKQVLEHRIIMEKSIGRKLEKNEVVHHKDGNKLNNVLSNLQLMDKEEHDRMHTIKRHIKEPLFGKNKRL